MTKVIVTLVPEVGVYISFINNYEQIIFKIYPPFLHQQIISTVSFNHPVEFVLGLATVPK